MSEEPRPPRGEEDDPRHRANFVYYFEIGLGDWVGTFHMTVTSWKMFREAPLGIRDRFLALSLVGVLTALGPAPIVSHLDGNPRQGNAGVVFNAVKISRFGITLYLLREHYELDADGRHVRVVADERFGPVPFLFRNHKTHSAEVVDGGMRAIYYLPLLGAQWVAAYKVADDRRHIDSRMICPWATAAEIIEKRGNNSSDG